VRVMSIFIIRGEKVHLEHFPAIKHLCHRGGYTDFTSVIGEAEVAIQRRLNNDRGAADTRKKCMASEQATRISNVFYGTNSGHSNITNTSLMIHWAHTCSCSCCAFSIVMW
jgi:hypothetical protein